MKERLAGTAAVAALVIGCVTFFYLGLGLTRFHGRVVLSNIFRLFAVDDAPLVIGLSMRGFI
jgi:hypothetical protein